MSTIALNLYKAQDGLDSYALSPASADPSAPPGSWLAQKGFGSDFEKVWTLELQSPARPSASSIDWDSVLERAIEAYHLSDPVIADYQWPDAKQ